MKAILEFNLDEPEDRDSHEKAVNGKKFAMALWDLDQWLRQEEKYHSKWNIFRKKPAPRYEVDPWNPEKKVEIQDLTIEDVREKIRELMQEYGISLEQ